MVEIAKVSCSTDSFWKSVSKHAKHANFDAPVKFLYRCWAVGQSILYSFTHFLKLSDEPDDATF